MSEGPSNDLNLPTFCSVFKLLLLLLLLLFYFFIILSLIPCILRLGERIPFFFFWIFRKPPGTVKATDNSSFAHIECHDFTGRNVIMFIYSSFHISSQDSFLSFSFDTNQCYKVLCRKNKTLQRSQGYKWNDGCTVRKQQCVCRYALVPVCVCYTLATYWAPNYSFY